MFQKMDNVVFKLKYVLDVKDLIRVRFDLNKLIFGWIICFVFEL